VLWPFVHIERNEKTGEFLNANITEELEVGQDFQDHDFDPPTVVEE
jgi:hypothetical protein